MFPLALLLRGRRARGLALFATILLAPVIRAAVAPWAVAAQYDPLRAAFAVYAFGPAHFDAFAAGDHCSLSTRDRPLQGLRHGRCRAGRADRHHVCGILSLCGR